MTTVTCLQFIDHFILAQGYKINFFFNTYDNINSQEKTTL